MKNISKILGLILAMTVLAVILAVGTFAVDAGYTQVETGTCGSNSAITWTVYENDVTGEYLLEFTGTGKLQGTTNNSSAPWGQNSNITKIVVGDGITALDNSALAYYRVVQTVELGKDVSSLGTSAFAGCWALQTIYRKGNMPEISTLDLRGITYFSTYVFDGCKSFSNIIFPTEGSYTIGANFVTNNSYLTSIYLPSACHTVAAGAFVSCANLKTVCGNTAAVADNAFENTITTPKTVTLKADENTVLTTLSTFQIGSILEVDDVTYVLYADKNCTTLLTGTAITQNTTVYAKKLFEFVGCEVRIADYNGLRFIFDYNPNAFSGLGYTVDVLGVLGAKNVGITPVFDHNYNAATLSDAQLIVDGEFTPTAKFLSYNSDSYRFAYTAIGYGDKDGGNFVRSNGAAVILSKAYISLTDSNGNQGYIYSAQGKKDLLEACKATKDTGKLTDTSFIDETLTGYTDNMASIKANALNYLNYIYSGNTNILSGQHLYSDTPTTVKDEMQKIYENTGKYPAVLSYDVAKGYRSYKDKSAAEQAEIIATLVEQFKDFSKQGGLITFCAHSTNPSGNYGANEYNGTLTTTEWNNLWTSGNAVNTTFMAELNAYVAVMQAMEDAGIPIFWRPYHEMNMGSSDKFWWSDLNTNTYTTLWINTYNYFVTTKGLENLIWIYSPKMAFNNSNTDAYVDVYYPGDAYVDIKAIDWYHNSLSEYVLSSTLKNPYNALAGVGSSKPMVYGEFGPNDELRGSYTGVDAINNLTKLKNTYGWKMGWVVFWSSFTDAPISLDQMDNAKYFMEHDLIFDLEESRVAFYDIFLG